MFYSAAFISVTFNNSATVIAMSDDTYFDRYDYYNFGADFDKLSRAKMASGSGHAKNKKMVPTANDRKMVTNIQNSLKKEKKARLRLNSV